MSDLDTFEVRFSAAYRRYLDKAPRQLDAAAIVRSAVEQPRLRPVAWPWALRPAQALVWIVLLALLLAAMAAAFIGSQRQATGIGCPAGSTPDKPGPVDQARPVRSSGAAMAFDRTAGRIVAVVAGTNGAETWTFDVCANTWAQMHPDTEPTGLDGWDSPVYDVDSDVTIAVDRDQPMNVWVYDLGADTWTLKGVAPLDTTPVAYDPLSGFVVAASRFDAAELWNYDVEANTWVPIHAVNGAAHGWPLAYDVSVDRIVAYGTETWLFDIRTGVWSRAGADTPPVDYGWSSRSIVYDEAAERTLVIGWSAVAYDASADRWQDVDMGASDSMWPYSMVYDSVNRRLVGLGRVGLGLNPGGIVQEGGVAAFDLLTHQWTVLFEGQAPDPRAPLP